MALRSKGLQQEGSAVGKSIGRRSVSFLRSLAQRRTFAGSLGEREGEGLALWLCLCLFESALKQFVYLPSAAKQPFLPRFPPRPGRATDWVGWGLVLPPPFPLLSLGRGSEAKAAINVICGLRITPH